MTLKKSILHLLFSSFLAKLAFGQENITDELEEDYWSIYDEIPEEPTNDPHNHNATEMLVDDQMFTDHQFQCMFNKTANDMDENTKFDCNVAGSRGFDKTVLPWYTYWNSITGMYELPILVDIATYPEKKRRALWNSLKWAKNHYAEHTRIDVQFVDEFEVYKKRWWSKGLIRIINSRRHCGCCSEVGLNKKKWIHNDPNFSEQKDLTFKGQTIQIEWCYNMPGKVVHELMHALGWVHEHQRDDRDQYLVVGNSKKEDQFNCGIIPHLEKSGTPYDLGSIMHYGHAGSCQISLRSEFRGTRIGQRDGFSEMDIEEINAIYPPSGPKFTIN